MSGQRLNFSSTPVRLAPEFFQQKLLLFVVFTVPFSGLGILGLGRAGDLVVVLLVERDKAAPLIA